jgi:hypothetical protein
MPPRGTFDPTDAIPRNDVYTGLLAISFFAMLIASVLLFVDWYGYNFEFKPTKVKLPPVPAVEGGAAAPKAPAGGAAPPAKEEPKPAPMPDPKDEMKKDEMKKDEMKKDEAKKE